MIGQICCPVEYPCHPIKVQQLNKSGVMEASSIARSTLNVMISLKAARPTTVRSTRLRQLKLQQRNSRWKSTWWYTWKQFQRLVGSKLAQQSTGCTIHKTSNLLGRRLDCSLSIPLTLLYVKCLPIVASLHTRGLVRRPARKRKGFVAFKSVVSRFAVIKIAFAKSYITKDVCKMIFLCNIYPTIRNEIN